MAGPDLQSIAQRNVRAFTIFRMCFNARFYYPVYALLFLHYGLTLEQFGILNGVWAATIVYWKYLRVHWLIHWGGVSY